MDHIAFPFKNSLFKKVLFESKCNAIQNPWSPNGGCWWGLQWVLVTFLALRRNTGERYKCYSDYLVNEVKATHQELPNF